MKEPFQIEWMGGHAERHFRRVRPGVDDLPWGTVVTSKYPLVAVNYARAAWTEVAINEYRAAASFTEVLRALIDIKAPLDLIGMASDFLVDECSHVEMASRLAMELGGNVERVVDMDNFARRPRGLTALQRANELVLRVSSVAEAFLGGTAAATRESTSHPLTRAVYESMLRDEARHQDLAKLYFEWAIDRLDDFELKRLGAVLLDALRELDPVWKPHALSAKANLPVDALHALGWLEPARFAPVARDVVVRDILEPLARIGIVISKGDREALLAFDTDPPAGL
ncbi:MAG: diiron oxygenase [Myxococcota bacterium]|nr:diiron oxygenase [Myxococcota bacterium]